MVRCANHPHHGPTYYHNTINDVKACFELKANGFTQMTLDSLADGVRLSRREEIRENNPV